jgi:hypothetical protein
MRLILLLFFLTYCLGAFSNDCLSKKDELGKNWAAGSTRSQAGGWIWFLGKGKASSKQKAYSIAEGFALNYLVQECEGIPKTSKFIERCDERIVEGDIQSFARISLRQKDCNYFKSLSKKKRGKSQNGVLLKKYTKFKSPNSLVKRYYNPWDVVTLGDSLIEVQDKMRRVFKNNLWTADIKHFDYSDLKDRPKSVNKSLKYRLKNNVLPLTKYVMTKDISKILSKAKFNRFGRWFITDYRYQSVADFVFSDDFKLSQMKFGISFPYNSARAGKCLSLAQIYIQEWKKKNKEIKCTQTKEHGSRVHDVECKSKNDLLTAWAYASKKTKTCHVYTSYGSTKIDEANKIIAEVSSEMSDLLSGFHDEGVKRDEKIMRKYCFKKRNLKFCEILAQFYSLSNLKTKEIETLKYSCNKLKHAEGCYSLAYAYFLKEGKGPKDKVKERKYFKKSCILGHIDGCRQSRD